jgi:phenylalanyl-tRNA synthetase alpha chain
MQNQLGKILSEAKEQILECLVGGGYGRNPGSAAGQEGCPDGDPPLHGETDPGRAEGSRPLANNVRNEIEALLEDKFAQVKNAAREARFLLEKIDVTEPGLSGGWGSNIP